MKMKPPVFQGIESDNAFNFLFDCHECLYKMGIAEIYFVELIYFKL